MTHRIVIVGGGAGGLELATRLGKTLGKHGKASVILVDANLTHIWKPLLHEVAAGSLNSSEDELNYVAQAKWNHFRVPDGPHERAGPRDTSRSIWPRPYDENGNELVPAREAWITTRWSFPWAARPMISAPKARLSTACFSTRASRPSASISNCSTTICAPTPARIDAAEEINVAIVGAGATGVELAAELHNAAHELAAYGLAGSSRKTCASP